MLVVLGAGCASHAAGRLSPDAQVIEDYVTAMAAGDVDGAMALRCPGIRIEDEDRDEFEDHLGRLQDDLGVVGVGRIELDDPSPPVVAELQRRDVASWRYWLTIDGEEADEPLLAFVGNHDGKRRICSLTTSHFLTHEEGSGDALDIGEQARAAPLPDLLPELAQARGDRGRGPSTNASRTIGRSPLPRRTDPATTHPRSIVASTTGTHRARHGSLGINHPAREARHGRESSTERRRGGCTTRRGRDPRR